jgi:hypothetical protein
MNSDLICNDGIRMLLQEASEVLQAGYRACKLTEISYWQSPKPKHVMPVPMNRIHITSSMKLKLRNLTKV